MAITCNYCERELLKGEWEGWHSTFVGLVCPNHDIELVLRIIRAAVEKYKDELRRKLALKHYNETEELLQLEIPECCELNK